MLVLAVQVSNQRPSIKQDLSRGHSPLACGLINLSDRQNIHKGPWPDHGAKDDFYARDVAQSDHASRRPVSNRVSSLGPSTALYAAAPSLTSLFPCQYGIIRLPDCQYCN